MPQSKGTIDWLTSFNTYVQQITACSGDRPHIFQSIYMKSDHYFTTHRPCAVEHAISPERWCRVAREHICTSSSKVEGHVGWVGHGGARLGHHAHVAHAGSSGKMKEKKRREATIILGHYTWRHTVT